MKSILRLLLLTSFMYSNVHAQNIPNGGFENWTNMGSYFEPDGWGTLNSVTSAQSIYTVTRGNPGYPGSYFIKITSLSAGAMGVIPGIAVSGTINSVTMAPESGFAYNQRPANLSGSWQHMIWGSSQGYIDIQLTRWDGSQRISVASAHRALTGMAMNWASFSIPLIYTDGNNPDTCMIILSASGPQPANCDYLWGDNLTFNGTVSGNAEATQNVGIRIYPNPAKETVFISTQRDDRKITDLNLMDLSGRIIKSYPAINCIHGTPVSLEGIPAGTYLIQASGTEGNFIQRFTKE